MRKLRPGEGARPQAPSPGSRTGEGRQVRNCSQSHCLWSRARLPAVTDTKRSGHGFLSWSRPGGAQDQTHLTCVQGHPVHCTRAAWREVGQRAGGQDPGLSGEGGPPIPLPVREAPAARTHSDASRPCPPAPAWPCTTVAGGRGEGRLPARKRSAGWPASSLTPRAGPGLGHTGCDQPGVLTIRPGLLLPGDGMLDVQAGSVEESPAQLGREGHVPRWGWGEGRRGWTVPGPRGPGAGWEASCPAWTGHVCTAYRRGRPMSSA